ncbi:Prenylated Rab receptor 2 [Zea mays]|uniref:PRA1 family protein n=1 Tax=Zea mays TaxID=4577 RepID=A0A1D6QG97_MAIZE|nr:Prenylated Rab receptor 2 [Zea mays]
MAAASPPLLPTTVVPAAAAPPTPAPTAISSADATDTNPAAIRAFLSRLLDTTRRALSGARPWSELADRSALSRPESLAEATSRLRKNLAYFRVNYAAVAALCLAAALLGRTFSDREVLGGLAAASAFVVFLTSVGSLIFSALALGTAIVCAHGACRVPEDLFLDDVDQAAGGTGNPLLSLIASATGGRV